MDESTKTGSSQSSTIEYATIRIERVVCQRRVGYVATVNREGRDVGHIEHGEIADLLAVSAALLGGDGELLTAR